MKHLLRTCVTAALSVTSCIAIVSTVSPFLAITFVIRQCRLNVEALQRHNLLLDYRTEWLLSETPTPQSGESFFAALALCAAPFLAYRAWCAAGPISERIERSEQTLPLPVPLVVALGACWTMPLWGVFLVMRFHAWANLAGFVFWLVTWLSVLCYVLAMAVVADEREGKQPGLLLLSMGHQAGGGLGVRLALEAAPENETLASVYHRIPLFPLLIAGLVGASFLMLAIR